MSAQKILGLARWAQDSAKEHVTNGFHIGAWGDFTRQWVEGQLDGRVSPKTIEATLSELVATGQLVTDADRRWYRLPRNEEKNTRTLSLVVIYGNGSNDKVWSRQTVKTASWEETVFNADGTITREGQTYRRGPSNGRVGGEWSSSIGISRRAGSETEAKTIADVLAPRILIVGNTVWFKD